MKRAGLLVALTVLWSAPTQAEPVYTSPRGGPVELRGETYSTVPVADALKKARPGSTVVLMPGRYTQPLRLKRSGRPGAPIKLRGEGAILVNGAQPGAEGAPALYLKGVSWVEVEDLTFEQCWPVAIKLKDTRYVTIRGCRFSGGRRAIYAKGARTHHLLVERNTWTQDPSRRIWTSWSWDELHHGRLAHFNGALLASKDIPGGVVFRWNVIRYAFNGIRLKAQANRIGQQNVNVEVYGNVFEYVRDNPVEPEGTACNWSIHHNVIRNAHGWFSFTNLSGGRWYVYRNVGWTTERPGEGTGHRGGKVLKLERTGPFPTQPFCVFNNTWYTRAKLVSSEGVTRGLRHWNNLIAFHGRDRFPPFVWHASYSFVHDLANLPFPTAAGGRSTVVGDPRLERPAQGDMRLRPGSPAIDAGQAVSLPGLPMDYDGRAPDIGAYEGRRAVATPSLPNVPAPYPERPRVLGLHIRDRSLRVFLSTAVRPGQSMARLRWASGSQVTGTVKVEGTSLQCQFPVEVAGFEALVLPRLQTPTGEPITLWATADPRIELVER